MNSKQAESVAQNAEPPFPIVGLGASAGGLEALELFLAHVPAECGLAFVIVQHLEPTHKGMLAEILQRATPMPVVQVTEDMTVRADHVYVIAPNTDLSILHGVLHAIPPVESNRLHLPIDFFFRSLAADQRERAVGVVLSGMGEDGAQGLRAIRENSGGTFAQDPQSAQFDSMPRAAIESGAVDGVYRPEELAGRIADYLAYLPHVHDGADLGAKDRRALEKVFVLLRAQTGHDFSLYKQTTIYRRLQRRMGLHRVDSMDDYVRYLRENPQEADLLFKELLIGVTAFFRDPEAWTQLREELVARIRAAADGYMFRAWSAGCSTGEEAFTLAMVFKEALAEAQPTSRCSLQIFATDLDADAINKARTGLYPGAIAKDVSQERLERFFVPQKDGSFCVRKEIRETVVFATQNLVMHPPFTKLDFVVCRNLLIYLDATLQQKIMALFHFGLKPDGLLLLGTSETVGPTSDLFAPTGGKSRLYRRLADVRPPEFHGFPFATIGQRAEREPVFQESVRGLRSLAPLVEQLLLSQFTPAAVLVTSEGDIVYVNGKTGEYLEPAAGRANWNIFAMSRGGLGTALSEAFPRAIRGKVPVELKGVSLGLGPGSASVDVTLRPIAEQGDLQGMVLIAFERTRVGAAEGVPTPVSGSDPNQMRATELAEQLRRSREQLQATREEMQASQEELRSSNEELQSLNEELQSTNEELTTSAEEARAMNEELQVVNQETQRKLDDLSRAGDDMKNLLDSVELAIVFLDSELRVRRFTPAMVSIIKLIPSDVGRPITDLVTVLEYQELAEDARAVLRTLVPLNKQVRTTDGRWFALRIMPYRTRNDQIDGTVITLSDITDSKNLESVLRRAPQEVVPSAERGKEAGGSDEP